MGDGQRGLIGTRMALFGAVLYLSEWFAILGAAPPGPFGPRQDRQQIVDAYAYADSADAAALAAAFFALVLIGRVVFLAGVKRSLQHRPEVLPLLDIAMAAMAVGVALEVASYGVVAAASSVTGAGTEDMVTALDSVGFWLNSMLIGPTAVSLLAAGLAMRRSELFPSWLSWLPLASGVAAVGGGLLVGAAAESWGPSTMDAFTSVGVLGMWIWMIGTGVVLLRRRSSAPHPGAAAA